MYVFDFDGTLVDTKAATIAAYTEAGVKKTPEEWEAVWGLKWREWLHGDEAEEIHSRKTKYLHKYMHTVRILPLMSAALQLRVPVITGASPAAVSQTLFTLSVRFPEVTGLKIVLVGVDTMQKVDYLDWASAENNMDLIYVDDSQRVRDLMNLLPGDKRWKAISPSDCLTQLVSYSQRAKTPDSRD